MTSILNPPKPDLPEAVVDVYDLRLTCRASPSQWEGRVGERGSVYIRYRWGLLTVRVAMSDQNAVEMPAPVYEDEFGQRTGDRLGGYMETDDMRRALLGVCRFHGPCDEGSRRGRHSDAEAYGH